MKIVLDTTILVRSNEHSQGLARQLLITVIESEHTLLVSSEMLYELARVLRYPRVEAFYHLTESQVFEYVNFLRRSSEIVALNPFVVAPIRDVNDIIVIQTAIIGEAQILCTGDDDFFDKTTSEYLSGMGITVLSDIALMHRLRSLRSH